jgi:hypothetical protein
MSAGKTPLSLVFTQIVAEGKVDMQDMCSKYVPELQGTVWDKISVWTADVCGIGYRRNIQIGINARFLDQ